MAVDMNISVPEDVARYLQGQEDASAAVADAVRRVLPEARRERQRAAAEAMAEYERQRPPEEIAADRALMDASNEIALRGTEW
jgi:hypothetical protein